MRFILKRRVRNAEYQVKLKELKQFQLVLLLLSPHLSQTVREQRASHPDMRAELARRRSACDGERSRSAPERTTDLPARRAFPAPAGDPRGQTEVLQQRARTARSRGSHREHDQPHARQRHAGPPEGAPVQGAGDRGPGGRENLHHQALRAPDLLQQLPGHHRGGLRLEGAELGF